MTAVSDMPLRVLVCGGRQYRNPQRVDEILGSYRIAELCHGAATGADKLAGEWATSRGIPVREYPADWEAPCVRQCYHGRKERNGKPYCPMAGLRRNEIMFSDFSPDLVIAFPGDKGTGHMKRIARAAGVHVVEVDA